MVEIQVKEHNYEKEFQRIYSDLYPTQKDLEKAVFYYLQQSSLKLAQVDENPQNRIQKLKFFSEKITEEELDKGFPDTNSSYLFSDIKNLIGEEVLDIVHLTPAVNTRLDLEESLKINLGKCITGCKKNNINIGNFSRVNWRGGINYLTAMPNSRDFDSFSSCLNEPSYTNPILVISDYFEHGEMLGAYNHYLSEKGVGVLFSHQVPRGQKILGFNFIGKTCSQIEEKFILDRIDFF